MPVERQSEMSASVPGRWWCVAQPDRWGRGDRWASAGKGDVASVSPQPARLPSWATGCFPLLPTVGCPAGPSSTAQPAASTCAGCGIVRNADGREQEELPAQGSQALCHKVLCRSFLSCLGVDLWGRGMWVRSWAVVVALCCPLSFCSCGEHSFVSPSLQGGLMYIIDIQKMMLGSSSVCRSC